MMCPKRWGLGNELGDEAQKWRRWHKSAEGGQRRGDPAQSSRTPWNAARGNKLREEAQKRRRWHKSGGGKTKRGGRGTKVEVVANVN